MGAESRRLMHVGEDIVELREKDYCVIPSRQYTNSADIATDLST